MTNEQRELTAEYLTYIKCPLDVRDKKDGRDKNRKWFLGDMFQRFVEGDGKTNPGLIGNINRIIDIIYLKAVDDDATEEVALPVPEPQCASPPQPPAKALNRTARSGGGGARKRRGGFSLAEDDVAGEHDESVKMPAPPPVMEPAKSEPLPESDHLQTLCARYGLWVAYGCSALGIECMDHVWALVR